MKKKIPYKFFNKDYSVDHYSELYKKLRFDLRYPANIKRLEIFINLLKKYKPKKIVDAGCGAGMPMVKISKLGFNIIGYDKSVNMVKEAKKNLKKYKLEENLAFIDDFENPKKIKNNSFDCILGMGAFFYSKNFFSTINNQSKKLKKGGRLIFSLRNKLFDIATFNDYTIKFSNNLYETDKLKKNWKTKYKKLFTGFSNRKNFKLKNIDDEGVITQVHNPLTIKDEISAKTNLKCKGIYFYHFHAFPPEFENHDQVYFRKESFKIENPNDWRGNLIASGFVLDCIKN